MEWTEDFKAEMRERYLRQIKVYLILASAFFLIVPPFYYYLAIVHHRLGFGDIFDYYALPLFFIYYCLSLLTFYILLKKTPWIRLTSWLILFWDVINVTLIAYCSGGPHFIGMVFYPVGIAIYSIYIHPIMATRLFILFMILLGCVSWLTLQEVIPYFPTMRANTEFYSLFSDYIIRSENHLFTYISYGLAVGITFAALVISNFIVRKLRQREEELSISNEQISRLSDKLKVYLPKEFVESLVRGDKDVHHRHERKKLTIFFSDIEGFAKATDNMQPEDISELLNSYLAEMTDIATKYGGTVDKFMGDAILIFFGDPIFTNDKDHALRCVKMAIEMQEKMKELREVWIDQGIEYPLRVRIGINTGYGTVGNFGSGDRLNYTIVGGEVNIASRLESDCKPDKILISHSTNALIKDEIETLPKGEIQVKGISKPIKVCEVVGLKDIAPVTS